MPARQVEPFLDVVRVEEHSARHLQLERPTEPRTGVGRLGQPQSAELDGTVELTGHPERTAPGEGDPHALLRGGGKLDRVGEEGGGAGPRLRGQAEPEIAVQVGGERTAVGWLEQRTAQEDGGALGRSSTIGPLRCGTQCRDGLRFVGRLGVQQVQSDGLHVDPLGGQHRGGAPVQERALTVRKSQVERVRHQRMGQREPVIGTAEEATGHQSVREVMSPNEVESRDFGGLAQQRSAAEDREGSSQVGGARGQSRELDLHAAAHLFRAERGEPRCDLGGRLDAFGDHLVDERAEQERVAAAGGVAGSDERRVGAGKPRGHQCLDGVWPQRSRAQGWLGCRGDQVGQRRGLRRRLTRAHGTQDAQAQVGQVTAELGQPAQ